MPSGRTTTKSIITERWWLSAGDEECPHCGMLYALEAEYRCPDCDAPTCLHCIVLHEDRSVCPDCVTVTKTRVAKGRR
jgi:hypothetical protein